MGVVETWYCDWHEPCESHDYVHEDDAADKGWQKLHRYEDRPSLIEGGTRWTTLVERHLCPECQQDPDVREQVAEGLWKDVDEWPPTKVKITKRESFYA